MGKATEMRVLMLTKVESIKETKEEVDPGDKANSILSMETTKEKGLRQKFEEIQRIL
jgi:hypothetical protein